MNTAVQLVWGKRVIRYQERGKGVKGRGGGRGDAEEERDAREGQGVTLPGMTAQPDRHLSRLA